MTNTDPSPVVDAFLEEAESLCTVHDHITRVIADLDIPDDAFTDQYSKTSDNQFSFDGMLRLFLYREVSGFSYKETHRRVKRWAYLLARFGLQRPPTQQAMTYTWRNRLSLSDRQTLRAVADGIRETAADHDLIGAAHEAPPLQPGEIQDGALTEREIRRAVQIARKHGFCEFNSHRAANAKFEDDVFWELQAYLSMVGCGTAQGGRRFARMSRRSQTPHGDTHLRTVKKMGSPNPQTDLSEWIGASEIQNWKRIRKRLLDPFDFAVEQMLTRTNLKDELREPVNVAIDITPWEFYPTPWRNRELGISKEDYPSMVSGLKDSHSRGYEFATLTVIGRNTPIILAIEPVKRRSGWEGDDAESSRLGDVVERLLEKAQRHVDMHKVMADREFDTHHVRDVVDQKGMTYLIPKRLSASQDLENIEKIEKHPTSDVAVEHDVPLTVDGRTHGVDFMYVPSKSGEGYAIFTTNAEASPERAEGLVAQYRDRWMIENEYKSIKADFLPATCSTDYRVRLFYFVAAVLMYNTWRLTNFVLRELVDVDLGESPPLTAGEVVELIAVQFADEIG